MKGVVGGIRNRTDKSKWRQRMRRWASLCLLKVLLWKEITEEMGSLILIHPREKFSIAISRVEVRVKVSRYSGDDCKFNSIGHSLCFYIWLVCLVGSFNSSANDFQSLMTTTLLPFRNVDILWRGRWKLFVVFYAPVGADAPPTLIFKPSLVKLRNARTTGNRKQTIMNSVWA